MNIVPLTLKEAERIVAGANHDNTLNEVIVELDDFPKEKWEC